MLSHVEFRSDAFPAYESEAEDVNPGRFGKRLAEFLVERLREKGEPAEDPIAEDWGWEIPIENEDFRLSIGVGNYEEHSDGFLCFIEPHKEFVRKFFKKIPAADRVSRLRESIDAVLKSSSEIREVKWWSHEDFNNTAG